ncbi:MAG TPA: hypothetical protein VOB72_15760 [Candidatus Dormibacteraeota bacterium]|nr:hypothetical protein [Candidatus Dormibacteraeota bacterium]
MRREPTVHHDPAATGAPARHHLSPGQLDELAWLLRALREAVERHRPDLDSADDVVGMVGMLARQLASDRRPNRPMVHALLHGIAEAAPRARGVVEAATALSGFLRRLG